MKRQNSKSIINERTRVFIQEKSGVEISLADAEEIRDSLNQFSQTLLEIAKEHGLLEEYVELSKKESDGSV